MSKFIARTFDDPIDFNKFVESLDPRYTDIISITKIPKHQQFHGIEYSIVAEVNDNRSKIEQEIADSINNNPF